MAGFGFSPSDIVGFCTFSFRIYKAAKSAPERYMSARDLANRTRLLLDEISVANDQADGTMNGLASHLERANKAYKDLDEHLCQFRDHFDQQRRPPVRATSVAARVRWTTDQLDGKVDKLQGAVQSALGYCQVAMILQLR